MKKVFLFAALVLACTAGSNASAMNEAALNASNSELMPVKKSTKKTTKKSTKKTTKKSSSKKTTAKKSTASASTASAAPTTTSSSSVSAATNTTANNTSATVNSAATVAGVLGAILGGSNAGNGSNSSSNAGSIINGILNNVIGSGTFKQADLCHTWKYSKPGCAFTSENLLAKAGGEIAASKVENKLEGYYKKFGFSSSNTYFTFNTDGTFSAKIDGKAWNGTYTFDEKTHAIQLKGLLLSASGYATKTTNGISLLFDQKKLLNLIKALSAFKGSSTLSAVGSIANNYDGMQVGFEMTK
ncbi:DUF4923 family protein [Prevotella copri]|uniref:DUF4923 family protein n=1 Tax=Segatella copri TaxID=165179 RepID=UPI00222E67AB|nr:DUF4923 family protein [Segatella copri]MCW4119528.1 DUF4923 family protein [Segatella copri]